MGIDKARSYARKSEPQLRAVKAMVDALMRAHQ